MPDGRFHILFVCTANICRSPMAERVAAAQLTGPFSVSSAGTRGHHGDEMHPYAAETLVSLGVAPDGFRARQLDASQVAGADLILTATRKHRSAVVSLDPTSLGRAFTIPQFARLVAASEPVARTGDPVERAREVVREAVRARATLQPVDQELDEIADPYGHPREEFAACAALLEDTLRPTLAVIAAE
ncbi:MAG TPA: low molecular weight phosphatase family protein [Mycobacteriales bacterium]|jgi:protein-tyrosine phosphatase|nr:low molecular weight phosphatase family protein [Mycobacteriales bacterium]